MSRELYSVGDPGRAALEMSAGAPATRIGPSDVELSAASLPGMLIRAATSRGLEHRATGTPRQDSFALGHRNVPGEASRMVAVVCNGVGELRWSDAAAAFVSRRLAGLGADGISWAAAFAQVNEQLREYAQEAPPGEAVAEEMATTAVAVVMAREADVWVGEAAWVGDSTLWHLDAGARWQLITGEPDEDIEAVYHTTEVAPLPSADGACASIGFRLTGGALFVMSDGVANPLRWSRDVQVALAKWWARPPDPFTFAEQIGFARKSHMDDRTVIGIWPDGGDGDDDGDESGAGGREGASWSADIPR